MTELETLLEEVQQYLNETNGLTSSLLEEYEKALDEFMAIPSYVERFKEDKESQHEI